ncbi:MAG TPA: thioredoxin-dependent thiol peroxidase [Candidatus Kapabacteria bacterium]|nr:thioredoxin-dependent thiol peroxidase [Candidatus Kapabacteria bacterium]
MIEKGNIAPIFEAKTNEGGSFNLKDYLGQWIILYFYPKDDTSGCTKEACDFRDNMERLTVTSTKVFGVSPDNIDSHNKFVDKYDLNFTLIADPNKEICNLYGVIGEKKMFGKSYLGLIRTTYIISPDGKIAYSWQNVKVNGHVEAVILKLNELTKK